MRFLVIAVLSVAIAVVIGGYIVKKLAGNCPGPIINHVPYNKTFIEEQEEPAYVMAMYKNMFWNTNPWEEKQPNSTQLKVGRMQPNILGGLPKTVLTGKGSNRDDYLNTYYN